jgi:hypothetical protein
VEKGVGIPAAKKTEGRGSETVRSLAAGRFDAAAERRIEGVRLTKAALNLKVTEVPTRHV